MELNPQSFRGASDRLKKDFGVVTLADASKDSFKPPTDFHKLLDELENVPVHDGEKDFVDIIQHMMEEKLNAHKVFVRTILPAINFGGGDTSKLKMLNQGMETAKAYIYNLHRKICWRASWKGSPNSPTGLQ